MGMEEIPKEDWQHMDAVVAALIAAAALGIEEDLFSVAKIVLDGLRLQGLLPSSKVESA